MVADTEKRFVFGVGHTRPLESRLKGFVEFLEEFNKETARGVALTAAAFLDDLLERVLSAFLIPNKSRAKLMKESAQLGTFSARIAACHAMGLISEQEFKECELIRKVRNEFAHRIKMSFNDNRVRGLCSALTMSDSGVDVDARGQFQTAAVTLILKLTDRPRYVAEQALKCQNWKT